MMSVTIESPPQLEFINQSGEITPQGRLAHELANSDLIVQNHTKKEVFFAISSELLKQHQIKRGRNLYLLGISGSGIKEKIDDIKNQLEASGFPIHRRLPEIVNENTPKTPMIAGHAYAIPLGIQGK